MGAEWITEAVVVVLQPERSIRLYWIELRPYERVPTGSCAVAGITAQETQPGEDAVYHTLIVDRSNSGFIAVATDYR
jgi:hypothetical protein